MSIHKIVEDVMACMKPYDIKREEERFEMMYCTARIERDFGTAEAMTRLNEHLDKHYSLRDNKPPMCEEYTKKPNI